MKKIVVLLLASFIFSYSFGQEKQKGKLQPDKDNAELKLPAGFGAIKVAGSLGHTRHIAVTAQGDIYVKLLEQKASKGILFLHNGKVESSFGNYGGTGIAIKNGYLYASSD